MKIVKRHLECSPGLPSSSGVIIPPALIQGAIDDYLKRSSRPVYLAGRANLPSEAINRLTRSSENICMHVEDYKKVGNQHTFELRAGSAPSTKTALQTIERVGARIKLFPVWETTNKKNSLGQIEADSCKLTHLYVGMG